MQGDGAVGEGSLWTLCVSTEFALELVERDQALAACGHALRDRAGSVQVLKVRKLRNERLPDVKSLAASAAPGDASRDGPRVLRSDGMRGGGAWVAPQILRGGRRVRRPRAAERVPRRPALRTGGCGV